MNARASDIYHAIREDEGYGAWSPWMCEAMRLHYLYPYNVQDMLDRGLDNLTDAETAVFNAFLNAAMEARRKQMKELMEASKPGEECYEE